MHKVLGIILLVFAIVFADLMMGYIWAIPLFFGSIVCALIMFWVDYNEWRDENNLN